MDFQKESIEILNFLKHHGMDRGEVAKKLAYKTTTITETISKGGTEELLTRLKLLKELVLFKSMLANSQPEGQSPPVIQGDVLTDLEELKKLVDRIGKKIQEERTSERGKSLQAQANRDLNKGSVKSRSTSGRDRLEKDSSSGG